MIYPDDLEIGKIYRFDYISNMGKHCCQLGKFTKITKELGYYWFWFEQDIGNTPFDYSSLNNIREVKIDE